MSGLDFAIVANNTDTITINVLDGNGNPVNGSSISKFKWQWFTPGAPITKYSTAGQISVITASPLVIGIAISAADTVAVPEGSYPHEVLTIDSSSNPVTITNNDARVSPGTGYLRKQLTVPG